MTAVADSLEDMLLQTFKKTFEQVKSDAMHLRPKFIRHRFTYLRQYCEKQTGEKYTPVLLAQVLTTPMFQNPGSNRDPWADSELKGDDYIEFLFRYPVSTYTPKEQFLVQFNQHLREQGVLVELRKDGARLVWRSV